MQQRPLYSYIRKAFDGNCPIVLQNDIFFCDWVCHRFRILRIWVSCMKIAALDCLNPWFPALESANRIPAMANHTMAMANHTLPCLIDDGTVCQGRAVTGLLPVWAVMCVCVCVCVWVYVCVSVCACVFLLMYAVYWVCIGLNSWGELCLVRFVCLWMNGCVSFECEELGMMNS